jgi:UrcA family protein
MNTTTRFVAGVIFTSILSGVGTLAYAADSPTEKTVKYADLNVSNPQDAAILYKRIQSAAVGVCSRLDHGTVASKRSAVACTSAAIANAVGQVNQPALNALFNEKNGHSIQLLVAAK